MKSTRFVHFRHRRNFRYGTAVAFLLGIGALAAYQRTEQVIAHHEDSLAAAGFMPRPANTPARQALLNLLPAHRFVQRLRGDTIQYIYADPEVCDCLFVGSQQAYDQYNDNGRQQHVADEHKKSARLF